MEQKKFIIGITGGSGVGKTTLIDDLNKSFQNKIVTLSLDNYYKPKNEQSLDENGIINFDLPSALYTSALEKDLMSLMNNETIIQKQYNFNNPESGDLELTIESKDIVIVEGLFVMHYPFIREKLDYSVYLTVDKSLQLERRLKRDVEERNYDRDEVIYQWNNHVIPAYDNFVNPYQSLSDLIITNNLEFDSNLEVLKKMISKI